jgi:hypothetical protein
MAIALAVLMLAAGAAVGDRHCMVADSRDEAGVRAAEARWVAMLEARDADGLSCLLAPEFVDTNWAGATVSRDRILAALPRRPHGRLVLSEVTVALHGDLAVVRGLNRQQDAVGRPAGVVRFTDIFLYRSGRWQAISAQETPVHAAQHRP